MIVGWYGFERGMNKKSERKDWSRYVVFINIWCVKFIKMS